MNEKDIETTAQPSAEKEYDPLHLAAEGEATVICPECGLPVPVSMKYCPYCGIRMRGGCRAMLFKLLLAAGVAAAVIWLIVR
ncbi:hypothetical protein IMSAGC022_01207 [Alistipes sp.]|jgi:hypothetical protein|nr:zinc-ribbon domain-containing protein [Alistipes sp.]GFI54586.1 hypothetical protein IMSAGC022_01207 [Alistipes sp.]